MSPDVAVKSAGLAGGVASCAWAGPKFVSENREPPSASAAIAKIAARYRNRIGVMEERAVRTKRILERTGLLETTRRNNCGSSATVAATKVI